MTVFFGVLLVTAVVVALPLMLIGGHTISSRLLGGAILLFFLWLGFLIMNRISLSPEEISRGNVGALFLPVALVPLLYTGVVMVAQIYSFLSGKGTRFCGCLSVLLLTLGVLLYLPLRSRFAAHLHQFGSPSDGEGSAFFNALWLNEYTYHLVFNMYSYVWILVIFAAIGCIVATLRSFKKVST